MRAALLMRDHLDPNVARQEAGRAVLERRIRTDFDDGTALAEEPQERILKVSWGYRGNPKMSHHSFSAAAQGGNRAPSPAASMPVALSVPEAVTSFAGGMVEVVALHLDGDRAAPGELVQCLCEVERRRASRFVFERDRRRFIVARARLRHLLALRLGIQPDAVELVYGPQGKPALCRRFAGLDLRFNVSHSEDVAVYAFSRGCEIGVDVEFVREMRDADDIAARFFSRRENEAYLALGPRDRPLGFFNCWTRKEAFIKALGEGLSHPLDRFDVSLAPGEPAEILRVGDLPGHDCGWRLESFSPAAGFVAAVVTGQF